MATKIFSATLDVIITKYVYPGYNAKQLEDLDTITKYNDFNSLAIAISDILIFCK